MLLYMEKKISTLFMVVGGVVGGYIPTLWGAGALSMSTLFFSAAGAILGIVIAFRITR